MFEKRNGDSVHLLSATEVNQRFKEVLDSSSHVCMINIINKIILQLYRYDSSGLAL